MSSISPNASGRSNRNDKKLMQQKSQDKFKSTDKSGEDGQPEKMSKIEMPELVQLVPQDDADKISQMLKLPLNEDKFFMEAHVNSALCKGCGSCASVCPSGAMQQLGFKENQTLAMLSEAVFTIYMFFKPLASPPLTYWFSP
jgi:heterodisulfide reductase subunit A-like polyferredoxin